MSLSPLINEIYGDAIKDRLRTDTAQRRVVFSRSALPSVPLSC